MPLKLDNEGELREAQAALFNINSVSGWLLLNYVGPSTVHFAAGGEGGVEEFVPHLEDDQIQYFLYINLTESAIAFDQYNRYALVRIGNIQEKGTLKTTIRDVFITWIGPGVGIIEKGKKTAFLGDAQAFLTVCYSCVVLFIRLFI